MTLENTPVKTPKTTAIKDFIVNTYKSLQNITELSSSGPVATMAEALAGIYILIYRYGTWAFNQIFFDSADDVNKKRRGNELGLQQGEGDTARLQCLESGGTTAATLAAGTLYVFNDLVFQTVSSTVVDAGGNIAAELVAQESGSQYTLQINDVLDIVSPLAGIPVTLTVASIVSEGQDGQPDSEFFDQIDKNIKLRPQGGSPGDYFQWVIGVAGITDIFYYQLESGEINVFPIAIGSGVDRFPSAADIIAVTAAINTSGEFVYHNRRPIGAAVSVLTASNEDYKIEIDGFYTNGGDAALALTIDNEITEYIETRRPENPSLGKTGDETEVSKNLIFNIVNNLTINSTVGFTVDNVRVWVLIPGNPDEEILIKRKLPAENIASVSEVLYVN